MRQKGAEALAGRTSEANSNRVFRQARASPHFLTSVVAQDRADRSVRVHDRHSNFDLSCLSASAGLASSRSSVIERLVEAMVLCLIVQRTSTPSCGLLRHGARIGDEVEAVGFPVINCRTRLERIGATDHIIDTAKPEFGHELARFLGNHEQVIDDVYRPAGKFLAQTSGPALRFRPGKYSGDTCAS